MGERGKPSYRAVIPMALVHVGGTGVDGATRLQKLVFLGQEEAGFPDHYEYCADRFGPYSKGLQKDIDWAIAQGYIDRNVVTNTAGHEKHTFSPTVSGIQYVKELLQHEPIESIFVAAQEIDRQWGDEPLGELLRYVYGRYDSLTTQSELDVDHLFDPDTESQFLEPDDESDAFLGVAPERVTEVNSSFDDISPNT